jgi:hypothetical protein
MNILNNGRRPTSPLFQGSRKPQTQCIVIVPFFPMIFPLKNHYLLPSLHGDFYHFEVCDFAFMKTVFLLLLDNVNTHAFFPYIYLTTILIGFIF